MVPGGRRLSRRPRRPPAPAGVGWDRRAVARSEPPLHAHPRALLAEHHIGRVELAQLLLKGLALAHRVVGHAQLPLELRLERAHYLDVDGPRLACPPARREPVKARLQLVAALLQRLVLLVAPLARLPPLGLAPPGSGGQSLIL